MMMAAMKSSQRTKMMSLMKRTIRMFDPALSLTSQ